MYSFSCLCTCSFLDTSNNLIRRVSSSGIISTVVGLPPPTAGGYNGDNLLALSVRLSGPTGIALDGTGDWIIADRANHVIRRVTVSTGMTSIIVGTGNVAGVISVFFSSLHTHNNIAFQRIALTTGLHNTLRIIHTNERLLCKCE
jgi:hypothetical protein